VTPKPMKKWPNSMLSAHTVPWTHPSKEWADARRLWFEKLPSKGESREGTCCHRSENLQDPPRKTNFARNRWKDSGRVPWAWPMNNSRSRPWAMQQICQPSEKLRCSII